MVGEGVTLSQSSTTRQLNPVPFATSTSARDLLCIDSRRPDLSQQYRVIILLVSHKQQASAHGT